MIKYYDKVYSSKGKTYERALIMIMKTDVKELTDYIFSEK